MDIAFGAVLLFFACVGVVLAYRAGSDREHFEACLYAFATLVVGLFGYRQATLRDHPLDRPVVGVIFFLLAAFSIVMGVRELTHREKPLREEKLKCAGLLCLAALFITGGVCQFLYVV